jgi:hypothetical protein
VDVVDVVDLVDLHGGPGGPDDETGEEFDITNGSVVATVSSLRWKTIP